ncbi:MAG: hypothetical protein JSW53_05190 [Candidatus Bathyarchaeota archaeon]|nr:MAG: hypothetical protein JSW53_05190 [Candidatus Bathyarchaeota archaeon]
MTPIPVGVPSLSGCYKNFPEIVHGVGRLNCEFPKVEVQQEILCTLHKLNERVFGLKDMTTFSSLECEVSFEFGMAEGVEFHLLDEEELQRFKRSIVERAPSALDFLCVIRYHTSKGGRRVPLRFDYYMLRFAFRNENGLELRVFHQRGIRRVSVGDLITFLAKCINENLQAS